MLRLHNTLTRQFENFVPLSGEKVTLYTCGPTVYDNLHVGNWAAYVYWDTLVRILQIDGFTVDRVMNITDVGHLVSDADEGEDKLEKGAHRENKTAWEIADHYTQKFLDGMRELNLVRALKQRGCTYQTSDGIYFDTSRFPHYADFAQLDLHAQKAGARVDANSEKRQPWDFALWKFTEPGKVRDMEWETPIDLLDTIPSDNKPIMGFPGWHLECSAIAMSLLGKTIDIHTGGIDHIPVHHTNEIAQSEAATGQRFANYWLHCNHLKINGGKISKSLGNGYTLDDLAKRGFDAIDLRMFILQGHYSNEGNFSFENLQAAHNRLQHWRNVACLRHQTHDGLHSDTDNNDLRHDFSPSAAIGAVKEALNDNLETPRALAVVDQALTELDKKPPQKIYRAGLIEFLEFIDTALGLQLMTSTPDIDDECKRLLVERRRARENKDWVASDELRDELRDYGVIVKDTAHDTLWSYADKKPE